MITRQLDYGLRKANSIILRLVLVILLYFISVKNLNYFSNNIYIISIITYIVLLFTHIRLIKESFRGVIRLILDIALINIFLFDKNLNSLLNFSPFIILIFNTINHSNKTNRFKLFLLAIHLSIFNIDNYRIVLTHHIIPLILYVFLVSHYLRQVFQELNAEIAKLTGDLFVQNINESSSHQILRKVKSSINKNLIGNIFKVEDIYLFRIINDKFVVVKGTQFVKEAPDVEKNVIQNVINNKTKILKNDKSITISSKTYNNTIWLKNKIYNNEYVFLICLSSSSFLFKEGIALGLSPIFNQVCRIFYLTNSLDRHKKRESKIIKEKVAYVLDAKNALHYVKNKLTPITTTIGLVDRYFKKGNELDEKKKTYIEDKLKQNKSNLYLRDVISKAEVLIKGVDNLLYKEDKEVSAKYVIDCVRRNWFHHFENIDDVIIKLDTINGIKLKFNEELFDFIFTDLIENMHKYGFSYKAVEFIEEGEKGFSVVFKNDVKDFDKKYAYLKEITEQYNHPDNDEIHARKTHGLSFVRRLMRRKQIINKIIIDKEYNLFIFKITFNTI